MADSERIYSDEIMDIFADATEELRVAEVNGIWAPVINSDLSLSEQSARHFITSLEERGKVIDAETKEMLLFFGKAVGAFTLRRLFQPFVSDQIEVRYKEDSVLDQRDAVRRVVNALETEPLRTSLIRMLDN